jgi:hypothetical protein
MPSLCSKSQHAALLTRSASALRVVSAKRRTSLLTLAAVSVRSRNSACAALDASSLHKQQA